MLSAKSLALCVLVCLTYARADIREVFQKSGNSGSDYKLHSNFHKSFLTYVKCSGLDESKATKKCTIFHTTMNADSKVASCDLVLSKEVDDVNVHPFTADKAILVSYTNAKSKEQYANYTIVHFPDCKTTEDKLYFESFLNRVVDGIFQNLTLSVNDDNTFDVLYMYNETALCDGKFCKMTFDAQTNKFNGPVASSVPYGDFVLVKATQASSSKFYRVLAKLKDDLTVIHFVKDGQVAVREYEDVHFTEVSTAHSAYRICSSSVVNTKVNCELIDESGKTISKISVDMGYITKTLGIYNLPNGEFLMVTKDKGIIYVTKVAADGKKLGAAQLPPHDVPDIETIYIEDANNEYCVTRARVHRSLIVYKECLSSDDLI